MVEGFNATQRELEILELRKEVSALKTNVEYWRLAAERRDTRKELTGLDVPEARTLDAPEPPQCEVQSEELCPTCGKTESPFCSDGFHAPAQARQVPWKGNLSVDQGALRVNADGVTLIDEAGVCWGIVFPDKTGSYDHASTIVSALSVPSAHRGGEA